MSSNLHEANEAATHSGKGLQATTDVNMTECPVTWKAYLLCAFASFGGIFFGEHAINLFTRGAR